MNQPDPTEILTAAVNKARHEGAIEALRSAAEHMSVGAAVGPIPIEVRPTVETWLCRLANQRLDRAKKEAAARLHEALAAPPGIQAADGDRRDRWEARFRQYDAHDYANLATIGMALADEEQPAAPSCAHCGDPIHTPTAWIRLGLPGRYYHLARPACRAAGTRAAGEQPENETPDFVTRVLELFSPSHADAYGDLFWTVDNGAVRLHANVSDVFAWGGADAEEITPATLPALERAYADLKAVEAEEFTAELYAARQRGMRPQGAAYPSKAHESWRQVSALYDACGPERELGLGNPKAPPTAAAPPAVVPQPEERP